jgi:hypothetical protein
VFPGFGVAVGEVVGAQSYWLYGKKSDFLGVRFPSGLF